VIRKVGEAFSQRNSGADSYFPLGEEAEDAGIFDTDYSYRDILDIARLSSDYKQVVFEAAQYEGKPCYHIIMEARPGKDPFYHRREMWVDKEGLYPLRMQVYGSTGAMLKTIDVKNVQQFKGVNFPVELVVTSATRRTSTRIQLKALQPIEKSTVVRFMGE
jgi:hypothetical protein